MTLREKIGQMTQFERTVATSSAIRDLSIGTHTLTSFSTLSFLAGFELVGGWNEFERPQLRVCHKMGNLMFVCVIVQALNL